MTDSDDSTLLNVPDAEAAPKRFSPDEMIVCDSCLRANPPTRSNCLYCATVLPAGAQPQPQPSEKIVKPTTVEGSYVVVNLSLDQKIGQPSLERVAEKLQLKLTDLENALSRGGPLPLTRVDAADQAATLVTELEAAGLEVISISEQALSPTATPTKIRALEFSDDGLVGLTRTSAERFFTAWADLLLLVTGRLQANHSELVARRKRGRQELVDRRETSNDESLFDLYSRSGENGWRVTASNFDFSSLGARKGITAFENFKALIDVLRERANNLEVDESYLTKRALLGNVWPLGEDTRRAGWRRAGAGKFDVSTMTTTDNENQFNNYSRLALYLKLREASSQAQP